jgi:hypothetical protein
MGGVPRSIGTGSSGYVVDEVASNGLDLSSSAVGSPTRTNVFTGKSIGGGGSLHCFAATYPRSLSAPSGNLIGIANTFTIAYWHYAAAPPGVGIEQTLLDIGAGGANGIRLFSTNALLELQLWDSAGVLFQHFTITNGWSAASAWRYQQLTWDGATLAHFLNGTLSTQTLNTIVNSAGTMTDTPRAICIGDTYGGGKPMTNAYISAIQIWNTVTNFGTSKNKYPVYLARNGKDLRQNFGLYTDAANLKHWWRPGCSPSQPGMDYTTPATGGINLTPNYDQLAITQWGPC